VATAVTAVAVLRDSAVLAADVIALAVEIVRVATGAVGLEHWARPIHHLRVVLVAFRAGEVAVVIQRFVGQRGVHVDVRNPHHCVVAFIALPWGNEMAGIPSGRDHAIVAGRARPDYLRMIDRNDRAPGHRAMAVLTDICRERVIRRLAGCVSSVVTTEAVVGDVGVVEICRDPCNGRMAIVAVVATRDVRRMLACRYGAVMT